MAKDHGPQIKDDAVYEALIRDGASKEKAARIANAKANHTLDHRSDRLGERTVKDLQAEAKTIGIEGRSKMNKDALIKAIREH